MEQHSEVLSVETPESVAFAYDLAGLGSRGIAFAIDLLVLAAIIIAEVVVVGGIFVVVFYVTRRSVLALGAFWMAAALLVLVFVTYWGYFVFGEVVLGRTPGKKALGIRVVRDDGSRVDVVDSLIRNFLRLIDALPGTYAVGIVSILISKKQKRVGDFLAGTVVVRDSGELVLLTDGGATGERDALAREFLRRRGDLTPEARYQVAVAVLAAYREEPGAWDEPTIAGRLAQLAGWAPES